jgi:PAS domain S-box-containing protein
MTALYNTTNHKFSKVLLFTFIFPSIALIIVGSIFFLKEKEDTKKRIQRNLYTIAEFKASQISTWLDNNFLGLNTIFNNAIFADKVYELKNNRKRESAETEINALINNVKNKLDASDVFVSDTAGNVLARSQESNQQFGEHEFSFISQTVQIKQPVLCDMHLRHHGGEKISLMSFIPVNKNINGKEVVIAVVTVFIDPGNSLFSLIERWPAYSSSEESFLVRIEGNKLLFLNELRFRKNSALKFSMSLKFLESLESGKLSAEGVMESIDYRNEKVLAAVKKIPNSPWILITKVDEDEVYGPIADQVLRIFSPIVFIIFTIGTVVFFYQKKSKTDFYKELYETELEAEKKLRESEEHYRDLFNNNPHPMWVYDLETLAFLEANDAAVDHYGYSREEYFSMTLKDIRPSDDIVRLLKNIEETKLILDQRIDHAGIWRHKKKDGTIIEVEITSHKINYKGRDAKLVFANDITERRRAERMLQESEEKYRSIFSLAPVGIYQSTMDGRFITVNEKLAQILGYNSKEELLQLNMSKDIYYNSKEREKHIARYEPLGSVADLEVSWKKKDGTPIWIQLTARALKDHSGKTLSFDGFVRDVSGLKEAETALRENQKLLSTVIETMPVGIWLIDAEGKIMLGNPAAQKIWAGAKYIGIGKYDEYKAWFVSTGKKIGADEWAAVRALKTGESIINEEIEIERFDGEHRFIYNSVVPIRNSNKEITGVIVVNQDITERKKAEKELIAAKKKAENSDKIKSEFLAQMSHEVRTPLNILLSFSSYMRDELEEKQLLTEDMEQSFFKINDAGKRIVRTMGLILSMSEVQSGSYENNPKQTDIYNEILTRLYLKFHQMADEKKLQFDLIKNSEPCHSNVDPYAIEQVLDNLIDNAIKFTDKGRATIYLGNNENGNLTITVEDTGIGIDEEYLLNLYTPFSQEDQGYSRRYEGNGLGLALAKKLCDMNNVAIEVSSKKGEGTAFTLTFPK